jgi:hypothetical protein
MATALPITSGPAIQPPSTTPPPVPAAVNGSTNSPSIVSTTGIQNEFNNASNSLNSVTSSVDPYAGLFQSQIANELQNNQQQQGNAISSATAKTANQENMNNAQEAATLYGVRAQNAASGTSRYEPAAASLAEASARNSYQYKYNALDQAEKVAVANAVRARQGADVKTLQENLAYIHQIQQEKQFAASMALKEYEFGNLSANQRGMLGIQSDRNAIAAATATGSTQTSKPNIWQSIGSIFENKPITTTATKFPGGGFSSIFGSAGLPPGTPNTGGGGVAGLFPGFSSGSTVTYNGNTYSVDPTTGNLTPIK